MKSLAARNDIVRQLQKEVCSLQSHKKGLGHQLINMDLTSLEASFPDNTFPTGAVHEFLSAASEDAAATSGFIAGILGCLMQGGGACLWVSIKRSVFPPALKIFGIEPHRVIFIDVRNSKEALWTIEEALKCEALIAVVGELSELSFTESRRLQLAVEQSKVTGFIHRFKPRSENTVACVTRWKITPAPSSQEEDLPGLGFPRWNVELLKVRNGHPGSWQIEWSSGSFKHIDKMDEHVRTLNEETSLVGIKKLNESVRKAS